MLENFKEKPKEIKKGQIWLCKTEILKIIETFDAGSLGCKCLNLKNNKEKIEWVPGIKLYWEYLGMENEINWENLEILF